MAKSKKKKELDVVTNTQAPQKELVNDGTLEVNSIWHTIQGEGPLAGVPAFFIRLAGCNLQCPGCDTEYTKILDEKTFSEEEIVDFIKGLDKPTTNLVVITGGEPFRQRIDALLIHLNDEGYHVQVETNGMIFRPFDEELFKNWHKKRNPDFDLTVVCSPKTAKISEAILPYVDAYKYVITDGYTDADGLPNQILGKKCEVFRPVDLIELTKLGRIYVQPYDDGNKSETGHRDAALKSAMTHGYNLSVQLHKLLGIE